MVPGEDPEPTEEKKGHLTIEKVTTSKAAAEDGKYALGEEISYKITVLNDGNLTITDIEVTDDLTGDKWTIKSLAPKASEEFETKYTVTEEDVLAGEVLNVATAKGTSPDPDEPDVPVVPGEDPEPTEEKKSHLTIEKVTTSKAAAADGKYALGEEIAYKITVLNDGNVTISNIEVTDDLTGDKWTIASLAPKTSEEFTTKYTVTEEDVLKGEVLNVATAKGTDPEGEDPEVVPGEDPEPVNQIFKLTIKYRYSDGRQAAATVTRDVKAGEQYSVMSPAIKGYICTNPLVRGTMPTRDVTVTVFYLPENEVIDDVTPLGLDNLCLNMGECIE